jgi:hypothetical protein
MRPETSSRCVETRLAERHHAGAARQALGLLGEPRESLGLLSPERRQSGAA